MTPKAERLTEAVTLYEGDAIACLPLIEAGSVDLATDPPYGIGEANGRNKSRGALAASRDYGNAKWDNHTQDAAVSMAVALSRYAIVFGGNYYSLPPSSCWLVWDKMNGANDFADCELAWTNLPKAVRRIQHRWSGMIREGNEERFHPTQKPLAVMRWCIRQLPNDGRPIFDPFAGSGTTLVAAQLEGRRAVGCEIDPAYCQIIRKRVAQADGTAPGTLFAATVPRPTLFDAAGDSA